MAAAQNATASRTPTAGGRVPGAIPAGSFSSDPHVFRREASLFDFPGVVSEAAPGLFAWAASLAREAYRTAPRGLRSKRRRQFEKAVADQLRAECPEQRYREAQR